MEYDSALKRGGVDTDYNTRNAEIVTLSEISWSQKDESLRVALRRGPQRSRSHRDRK